METKSKREIMRSLKRYAHEHNAKLVFEEPALELKRASSLWYGGSIATIDFGDGLKMLVDAIGDVVATLYNKDGDEIEYVKDKRNGGGFSDFRPYIKTDKQLRHLESSGRLYIDNNNWYEISCEKDGKWYDMQWCSDSDTWWEAIEEAIDGVAEARKFLDGGEEAC